MASAQILSRLPVKGATPISTGSADAGKVPLLNEAGKLDVSIVQSLFINDVYVVADQAERLAHGANVGDVIKQIDTSESYMLHTTPASVNANWVLIADLTAADWSMLTNKPSTFPPTIGSGSGDAVAGNDARLTDERVPTTVGLTSKFHAANKATLTDNDEFAILDSASSGPVNQPKNVLWSYIKSIFCLIGDSRLTNDRFPTAHKSTHATGGTDAMAYSDIGAAPTSHTHGNITNAGAIGSTANLPVITTTSGVLTAGAFGTGSTDFTVGNDARLSNARTPVAHASTHTAIGSDPLTLTKAQISDFPTLGTAAAANLGTGASDAAYGNHSHTGIYDPAGAAAAITPTTLGLVIGTNVLAQRTFGDAASLGVGTTTGTVAAGAHMHSVIDISTRYVTVGISSGGTPSGAEGRYFRSATKDSTGHYMWIKEGGDPATEYIAFGTSEFGNGWAIHSQVETSYDFMDPPYSGDDLSTITEWNGLAVFHRIISVEMNLGFATAAQGALADTALQDAAGSIAQDGLQYARKDGAWVEVVGGGGGGGAVSSVAGRTGDVTLSSGDITDAGTAFATSAQGALADSALQPPLFSKLLAHWKLDETSGIRYDSHGSYDLTDHNDVGYAAGKIGNAADFVATSDQYLSLADQLSNNSTGFAISFWYKGVGNGALVCCDDLDQQGWILFRNGSSFFILFSDANNHNWQGPDNQLTFGSTSDNVWTSVVVSMTVDGKISCYQDGELVHSQTGFVFAPGGLTFGRHNFDSARLTGNLDSISLWHRALSPVEVTGLYNSGSGLGYDNFASFVPEATSFATAAQGALADTAVQHSELSSVSVSHSDTSTNATNATYAGTVSDLTGHNLSELTNDAGFLTDATAFATSAQGALADTALQDATAFATAAQGSLADSALQDPNAFLPSSTSFQTPLTAGTDYLALDGDGSALTGVLHDASAFATAAQGSKADSAVQPTGSGADLTGITHTQVGAPKLTESDTPPVSPSANDLWFNSTDATLAVYYGNAWVIVSGPRGPSGYDVLGIPVPITTNTTLSFDTHNGRTIILTSSHQLTLNTGLTLGFGCAIKGDFTYTGSSTIIDERSSGAVYPLCSVLCTGTDTYSLVGTKL